MIEGRKERHDEKNEEGIGGTGAEKDSKTVPMHHAKY